MSATDEELRYVHDLEMDHVTYILSVFRQVAFSPLAHAELLNQSNLTRGVIY